MKQDESLVDLTGEKEKIMISKCGSVCLSTSGLRANSCLNQKCGRRRRMDGVTQSQRLQRHAEAKLSSVPHRHPPLKFCNNAEGDGRRGWEVQYKHKFISLTTSITRAALLRKAQEV